MVVIWLRFVIINFNVKSRLYLKINKDNNNVFLKDGKILKVGRSPEVPWSLPHLPPLTAFSAGAETYYFKFQGGAYSQF